MAELLIKAQEPWNNDDPKAPANRTRKGDIIVVKPDGWKWGKEENPPRFMVMQIPELKYEDAKKFEDPLVDDKDIENSIVLKLRKHAVDIATVDICTVELNGKKEFTKSVFNTKLITKVS